MSHRSGYARLLRLRHTNLDGYLSLVLFEGSVAVALFLAYAELMSFWGAVAVPIAVAVMVKYHDVITGVLARPAAAAQLQRPRPRVAVGRSPVPRPSRPTTWIELDDAVPYPPVAHDGSDAASRDVVRGVASVPSGGRRPPAPSVRPGRVPAPVSAAPAVEAPADPDEATETIAETGALRHNTAAMRMRGNQGRFG